MPDTTNYMLLGYAVVTIILIASVVYLILKRRTLEVELQTLEAIEEDDNKNASKAGGMGGTEAPATSQTPVPHPR